MIAAGDGEAVALEMAPQLVVMVLGHPVMVLGGDAIDPCKDVGRRGEENLVLGAFAVQLEEIAARDAPSNTRSDGSPAGLTRQSATLSRASLW